MPSNPGVRDASKEVARRAGPRCCRMDQGVDSMTLRRCQEDEGHDGGHKLGRSRAAKTSREHLFLGFCPDCGHHAREHTRNGITDLKGGKQLCRTDVDSLQRRINAIVYEAAKGIRKAPDEDGDDDVDGQVFTGVDFGGPDGDASVAVTFKRDKDDIRGLTADFMTIDDLEPDPAIVKPRVEDLFKPGRSGPVIATDKISGSEVALLLGGKCFRCTNKIGDHIKRHGSASVRRCPFTYGSLHDAKRKLREEAKTEARRREAELDDIMRGRDRDA
jgi:hypothetical protein